MASRPNRLNWNLLRAFAGIAEHRTLADAARAAGVQRPTISEKVAALEAVLGLRLMDRQPGNDRFRLTADGRRLRRLLTNFNSELSVLCDPSGEHAPDDGATQILRDVEEALSALERAKKALTRS
ncbi:LysR family transcriptional regulator [Paraburkholderia sp. NMBU_R16]|uniref:helix-turn-helix domain-containing protein n=1 Tax=Paraburkholderia sp. NMBU_R16 TaxID=2698676 RepID=UPI001566B985|nr:LysR family transcriptional regulator [Paraburkholderia sp. NMBU_R16]NRO98135.1 LysR family transcriptional regulator [Paraburkholderia sp. NMBU_R16]